MKICRNCGTANVSSGQFCFKCNANLSATEDTAKTVVCGNCSSANAVGAHFCFNCGQSMKTVTRFCNSCGAINRPEDVYCLDCGRKILLDNPTTQQPRTGSATVAAPVTQAPPVVQPALIVQPEQTISLQPVVPVAAPQQVYMKPAPVSETGKYRPVQPPSVAPSQNLPQTKQQYRIQLFLMLAALGGMFYVLTQTFLNYIISVEAFGVSVDFSAPVSGIAALFAVPFKILGGETSAEIMDKLSFLFTDESTVSSALLQLSFENLNFATVFAYALTGVITITALVLVIGAVGALIRLIFNKPYNNTRRTFFILFMLNLVLGGIALLSAKVDFVQNLFLPDDGTGYILEPDMFFYIFVGGLLLLFIMSRIARVKTPKVTKRQVRKAERKAKKKVKKQAAKAAKKASA